MKSLSSITPVDVLDPSQAAMVDTIKRCHAGVRRAYEDQVTYAFLCGLAIRHLQDTCTHGNSADSEGGFKTIREAFLPELSKSAAYRYLDFTKACIEKIPTVGIIQSPNLLLQNGELPADKKQVILDAVHEAADGKTWTAFYRDLKLIREPQPRTYHPPHSVTPDEAEAAMRKQADGLANTLLADMALISQPETWSLLSTDRQTEIEDARLQLGAFIKSHTPKGKRKS